MKDKIKVIGFDADDTLWKNEDFFRAAEDRFAVILSDFGSEVKLKEELFQTEMDNLKILGYGVKAMIISMVETAVRVTENKVSADIISQIIGFGKEILYQPIELLPGVEEVLQTLHGKHQLIVATKGDLLDQEQKLIRSSLSEYFHHIEIMSDKNVHSYKKLLLHLDIRPEEFVMIGNSLRSDILPPLELGCYTIHVPYDLTWQHEKNVDMIPVSDRFHEVAKLMDIISIIN